MSKRAITSTFYNPFHNLVLSSSEHYFILKQLHTICANYLC